MMSVAQCEASVRFCRIRAGRSGSPELRGQRDRNESEECSDFGSENGSCLSGCSEDADKTDRRRPPGVCPSGESGFQEGNALRFVCCTVTAVAAFVVCAGCHVDPLKHVTESWSDHVDDVADRRPWANRFYHASWDLTRIGRSDGPRHARGQLRCR